MAYFLAAYIVIWLVLFGYVFSLNNRQRQLKRELEALKEAMKSKKEKE